MYPVPAPRENPDAVVLPMNWMGWADESVRRPLRNENPSPICVSGTAWVETALSGLTLSMAVSIPASAAKKAASDHRSLAAMWVSMSDAVLHPLILVVALIGTYSVNNSLFEVGSCIAFGILGWILKRYGYPPAPVVLGIVLGKLIEYNFRRAVIMGGYGVFFTDTLAFVVLSLATLSLFYPLLRAGWRHFRQPSR